MTAWLELVKKHTKMHKGKPNAFKLALKSAKVEYDQMKKKGMVHVKGESARTHRKHRKSQRGGEGEDLVDEDLVEENLSGGDIAGGKSKRKARKTKRSKSSKSRKTRRARK